MSTLETSSTAPSLSPTPPLSQPLQRHQRVAVLRVAITKLLTTTTRGTGTVLLTGDVVQAIAPILSTAEKRSVIDSIGSGSRLGAYCNDEQHIDRRPYTVALDTNFPGWTNDPAPILKLGLAHQSIPLIIAALTSKRENLHQLLEPLTPKEVALLLRLVWLSMSCPDMRFAFIQ